MRWDHQVVSSNIGKQWCILCNSKEPATSCALFWLFLATQGWRARTTNHH